MSADVRIHRSSDHLVLLDLGVIRNQGLSYGAIGLYAHLETLTDEAFEEFTEGNADHPLLQELLAAGVYRAAAE